MSNPEPQRTEQPPAQPQPQSAPALQKKHPNTMMIAGLAAAVVVAVIVVMYVMWKQKDKKKTPEGFVGAYCSSQGPSDLCNCYTKSGFNKCAAM